MLLFPFSRYPMMFMYVHLSLCLCAFFTTMNMNEKDSDVLLSHVVIGRVWYNNQLRMAATTVKWQLWMKKSNKSQMNNNLNSSSPSQKFQILMIEATKKRLCTETLRGSANWSSALFEVNSLRQHHHYYYFALSLSFFLQFLQTQK